MFDAQQLAALTAVVDEGTFDRAAVALHVTPSAVSQRIKALEKQVGQVIVTRSKPCRPTRQGEVLLRHARQVRLLEAETRAQFGGAGERAWIDLPVVVNADSLATWFRPVLAEVAGWNDVALQLVIEDEQMQARRLRAGEVVAAVTALGAPVQGCSVTPLGRMRYRPMVHRNLLPDPLPRGGLLPEVLARLPMVRFDADDPLQHDMLAEAGAAASGPVHLVPSSVEFVTAVRAGLGWGMLPARQLAEMPDSDLVPLFPGHRDVALFWQRWRIESVTLNRLSQAVGRAASALR